MRSLKNWEEQQKTRKVILRAFFFHCFVERPKVSKYFRKFCVDLFGRFSVVGMDGQVAKIPHFNPEGIVLNDSKF